MEWGYSITEMKMTQSIVSTDITAVLGFRLKVKKNLHCDPRPHMRSDSWKKYWIRLSLPKSEVTPYTRSVDFRL